MKKSILFLLTLCLGMPVCAQHMDFNGVELCGHVRDFTKKLEQDGFKLKEKRLDDGFYIFQGKFCGQTTYVNIHFTPKSKTVYQARVTPRSIDEVAFMDSVIATYGKEYEPTGEGARWIKENGGVFYIKKDSYDPFVIIMDAEGLQTLKKEAK